MCTRSLCVCFCICAYKLTDTLTSFRINRRAAPLYSTDIAWLFLDNSSWEVNLTPSKNDDDTRLQCCIYVRLGCPRTPNVDMSVCRKLSCQRWSHDCRLTRYTVIRARSSYYKICFIIQNHCPWNVSCRCKPPRYIGKSVFQIHLIFNQPVQPDRGRQFSDSLALKCQKQSPHSFIDSGYRDKVMAVRRLSPITCPWPFYI